MDDFDWVVPPYAPDMILPGREMDVEIPDVDRDICVLPDEFPVVVDTMAVWSPCSYLWSLRRDHMLVVTRTCTCLSGMWRWIFRWNIRNLLGVVPGMFDETAAVPMTLPVDEQKDSQVEEGPDVVWTRRDMDMGDPDVGRDIQVLTDVGLMMIDGSDSGPLSLPVVANTDTQVDIRWEATLEAVPFVVGGGCPTGWLDSESNGCVMNEIVLFPEMSPFVYMKSAVVLTFLPALSEVCSLAVLAGGRC